MKFDELTDDELNIIIDELESELKKRFREDSIDISETKQQKCQFQVECEWDFGVGIVSVWDDLECAQDYFKNAFKEEDVDYTYEEALKENLLIYRNIK